MLKKILLLCSIIPLNSYTAASSSSGCAATSASSDVRFRFCHGGTNFELTRSQCVSSRVLNEILRDVSSADKQIPLECIQTLSGYNRARQQGAKRLFGQAQSIDEFRGIDKQSYKQDLPMLSRMTPDELDTTPHGRLFTYIKAELNGNGLTDQDWKPGQQATLEESNRAYTKMFALLQDSALGENRAACDIDRVKGLMSRHLQTYSTEESSIVELADVATVCFDTLEVFNDAGVAIAVRAYNLGILQDLRPGVNVLTRAIAIRMINMYKKYYLALLRAGQRVERFPLSADISVDDICRADIKPLLFMQRIVNGNILDMSRLKITSLRGIEEIPHLEEVKHLDLSHNFFVELWHYTPELASKAVFVDSDSSSSDDDEMPVGLALRNSVQDDIDFYLPDVSKHCFSERWFEMFGALTHLDLSNNLLREVPLLPRSLTHLNLNNNCIENIGRLLRSDEGTLALPCIEMLDVRSNYITVGDVSRLVRAYRKRNNLNVRIFPQYSASYIAKCFVQAAANVAALGSLAFLGYEKIV